MEFSNSLKKNNIRLITAEDDHLIASIIRSNLKKFNLDIPGTAYFDTELDHLSGYYNSLPSKRAYFVLVNSEDKVIGGIGIAEFDGFDKCAEIQKLYLADEAKGKGMGKYLIEVAEDYAKKYGYKRLYLETHTNLQAAIKLYEKNGFEKIDKPKTVLHSAMNGFYIKELQ